MIDPNWVFFAFHCAASKSGMTARKSGQTQGEERMGFQIPPPANLPAHIRQKEDNSLLSHGSAREKRTKTACRCLPSLHVHVFRTQCDIGVRKAGSTWKRGKCLSLNPNSATYSVWLWATYLTSRSLEPQFPYLYLQRVVIHRADRSWAGLCIDLILKWSRPSIARDIWRM